MAVTIKIKRATLQQLNSAASNDLLVEGEPYFITDEKIFGLGINSNSYELFGSMKVIFGEPINNTCNITDYHKFKITCVDTESNLTLTLLKNKYKVGEWFKLLQINTGLCRLIGESGVNLPNQCMSLGITQLMTVYCIDDTVDNNVFVIENAQEP